MFSMDYYCNGISENDNNKKKEKKSDQKWGQSDPVIVFRTLSGIIYSSDSGRC